MSSAPAANQAVSASLKDYDIPFPLYTVGPATSRALNTLISQSMQNATSPFPSLRPRVLGSHTGTGDQLAQYILSHYNLLHSHQLFTYHKVSRLPVTPLSGPARDERMDEDESRLRKKALLFLVGEKRRDIIPNTLRDAEEKLEAQDRIPVDEVEVYGTGVMPSFQQDFARTVDGYAGDGRANGVDGIIPVVVVVVVFSPQGCESLLKSLGYIDERGQLTSRGRNRWPLRASDGQHLDADSLQFVIATIGPTTRDHLKRRFDFEADVCASKPSPEGVGEGIKSFLTQKGWQTPL